MARWASLIEQRRSERPVLLIDTGDFYPARERANQGLRDRYFFAGMNYLHYDAIGIGEYETKNDVGKILTSVKQYRFPFLSTNILEKESGKHVADPVRMKIFGDKWSPLGRTGGWRVGVFSVVLPEFVYGFGDDPAKHYYVLDPKISALETVTLLRSKGCSVVVAISHQGWNKSVELARDVPGIDIVVNSHWSHGPMRAERIGKTLVVDPGQRETAFTEVTVAFTGHAFDISAADMCAGLLKTPGDPRLVKLEKDFTEELHAQERVRRTGDSTVVPDTTK